MNRMFAIIEREMRKFFRSPTLMIMSLMMPILQLVIMGNAFGGKDRRRARRSRRLRSRPAGRQAPRIL